MSRSSCWAVSELSSSEDLDTHPAATPHAPTPSTAKSPYDVYTPITSNPDAIIKGIAAKRDQVNGGGVVLDLSHTIVTLPDLGDVGARVRGLTSRISTVIVFD
jgi:hypothetical protein